jgi:hypothetical protein
MLERTALIFRTQARPLWVKTEQRVVGIGRLAGRPRVSVRSFGVHVNKRCFGEVRIDLETKLHALSVR